MIIESKVVEGDQSRSIHVSRRGSNIVEKWVFVEQDRENYAISFYEKFRAEDDSQHTSVGVYCETKQGEGLSERIELEHVPLPDDLVAEIARIRRKISR